MSFLEINGSRAVSGRITIPTFGPWVADVILATSDPLKVGVTLNIGNLSLVGSVTRMASFAGSRSARIVGGFGGWRKKIAAKGYSHDAGVKLSSVLEDAARDASEKIAVANDRVIGTRYARRAGPASRVLRSFLDGQWWIDPKGVTQTKSRDSSTISSPFTVVHWSGGKGRFEIATEAYEDWTPGRKFQSPVVTGTQTISSVSITADNEGHVRLDVLTGSTDEERIEQDIRAIIREELARLEYGAIVEYEVTEASSMNISGRPVDPLLGWPDLSDVSLKASLLGEVVTPSVGSKALVFFLNGDPTKYRCIGIEGTNAASSFGASGDVVVTPGGIFKVAGGGNFVALANKVDQGFSSLVSYLSTLATSLNTHVHTSATAGAPTSPPVPASFTGPSSVASTAASKLKTD